MAKKPKQDSLEIWNSVRKDWGGVKPYSQEFKDHTKYDRKQKYKKKNKEHYYDDYENDEEY